MREAVEDTLDDGDTSTSDEDEVNRGDNEIVDEVVRELLLVVVVVVVPETKSDDERLEVTEVLFEAVSVGEELFDKVSDGEDDVETEALSETEALCVLLELQDEDVDNEELCEGDEVLVKPLVID